MPKGVEHVSCYFQTTKRDVKVSLMPKGVEHFKMGGQYWERTQPVKVSLMPKGVEHALASAANAERGR